MKRIRLEGGYSRVMDNVQFPAVISTFAIFVNTDTCDDAIQTQLVCLLGSPEGMTQIQVAVDRDPRHHQGWVTDRLELQVPVVKLDHSHLKRDLPVEDTVRTQVGIVIFNLVYRLVLNTSRNPLGTTPRLAPRRPIQGQNTTRLKS